MQFSAKFQGGWAKLRKFQGGWVAFIYFVVSLVLSIVLSPKPAKPKAAALEDFDVPVAEEDRPVPVLFGTKRITGANVLWYGDLRTTKIKKKSLFSSQTVGYKYYLGMHLALCHGPVDAFTKLEAGDKLAWSGTATANTTIGVNAPDLFGGQDREGGMSGSLDVMMGAAAQVVNPYLEAKQGAPQPAYRGVFGLVWNGGYIGNTPYVKAWAVTAKRILAGWAGDTPWYPEKAEVGGGMNAAHIVYQCLTDAEWGQGSPTSELDEDNFRDIADQLYDEGFGLNMLWNQSTTIEDFIGIVMDHIAGMLVFDHHAGKYQIRLVRGDYDPATLETFDKSSILEVSNFQRRSWGETINELTISYTDPDTQKATAIIVQDLGNIRSQQQRVQEKIDMSGINSHTLIRSVAGRELAARSTPLARMDLRANRRLWRYGPGSVIKITWPEYDVDQMVIRILNLKGGTLEDGKITVSAVEDIYALGGIEYSEAPPAPGDVPSVPPATPSPDNGNHVVSTTLTAPPSNPLDGDTYLVASPAENEWIGHEGELAEWDEDNQEWIFIDVANGSLIYDEETGQYYSVEYGATAPAPWTPAIPGLPEEVAPDADTMDLVAWDTVYQRYVRVAASTVGGSGVDNNNGGLVYADGTVPSTNRIANTASEVTFESRYTFAVGSLIERDVIVVELWGVWNTDASAAPTIRLKLRLGTDVVLDSTAFATATAVGNRGWSLRAYLMVTDTDSSGQVEAQGELRMNTTISSALVVALANTVPISVDLLNDAEISVSVQFGAADADNMIELREMAVYRQRPPATDEVVELSPVEMSFSALSIDSYFDPQPVNLIDGTELFTSDAGQFTKYTEGTAGTFTATGNGQILHNSGAGTNRNDIITITAGSFSMPQAFVGIDVVSIPVTSTGYDNSGVGLVKDANNFVFASIDRAGSLARIQIKIAGVNNFLGSIAHAWAAPFKIGFSMVGNSVYLWEDTGTGWVKVMGADVSAYYDFRTTGNLTGWKPGFTLASQNNATWNFDNLKWGRFGGVGIRDQTMVTNEDGTPYIESGRVYFSATLPDPGGTASCGVFRFDMATYDYEQMATIMVERGGKVYNDLIAHIIWYANGDRRLLMNTWGNGFGGDIQVLHKLETTLDLISGSNVVASMTQLSLPGLTTAAYGAYDAMLAWDVANSRWLIGYTITPDTTFAGSPFYAAAAHSTDLSSWTAIGADTANDGYEGTKLVFVDNAFWILAGGPAGSGNSSRVYTQNMTFVGSISATFSGGADTQPHPTMWPYQNYVYLVSFNNTKYLSGNFTWGQPTLQRSARYQ